MPNRNDILAEIRKADPRAANVPDDELADALSKKYPQYAEALKPGFSKPKSVRERATANLAAEGTDRAGAKAKAESIQASGEKEQAAGDRAALGEFASTMVKGGSVAAASLFTGGLALGPALSLMGGTALAGSILGQAMEEGAGVHKSLGERAGTAALDVAGGLAGEGIGRGIGVIGKTLVPKMAAQAAATTERGAKLFDSLYQDTSQQLLGEIRRGASEGPMVNVGSQLKKAYDRIGNLPFVKGPNSRFGGMTDKVGELMQFVESKLSTVDGQISSHQPVDRLIEMKRSIQSFAYKEKEINRLARPIIKDLATDLDTAIKGELKTLGPKAETLYKQTNDLVTLLHKSESLTDIAKVVIKKMTFRLAGSALGAEVGGRTGGGRGAAVGAIAGIAAPEISALVLQQVAAHPGAAKLARAAVTAMETGAKNAPSLMQRAIEMAGADETIKQTADDMKSQQFNISQ